MGGGTAEVVVSEAGAGKLSKAALDDLAGVCGGGGGGEGRWVVTHGVEQAAGKTGMPSCEEILNPSFQHTQWRGGGGRGRWWCSATAAASFAAVSKWVTLTRVLWPEVRAVDVLQHTHSVCACCAVPWVEY